MSGKGYPEELKTEAVRPVADHRHSIVSVATRLDTTTQSLDLGKKSGPIYQSLKSNQRSANSGRN
ncbi:Uncharacterised protein [Yersinia intermedia]|jgi:transposase|nr:Uncharacterised protein [Yersinia intermedia]